MPQGPASEGPTRLCISATIFLSNQITSITETINKAKAITTFISITRITDRPISELRSGSKAIIIMLSQSSDHLPAKTSQLTFQYLNLFGSKWHG